MTSERFNPMLHAKAVKWAWPLVYKPDVGFYEYLPEKGLWAALKRDYVEEYVVNMLNGGATPGKLKSVRELVEKLDLMPSDKDFNEWLNLINLRNGMCDISNKVLLPHHPDLYSSNQLNVNYNPDAKAPRWFSFMEEIFDGDSAVTALIQEFMGYSLVADTRFEKALILVGEGANGKSTMIKVWEELIGHENIASVTLTNLKDQFHRASLHGKLLNIAAELSATTVEQSDYFKRIVSGDTIDAAHKFKDVFHFKPYARLVYAMNEMPRVKDNSHGFYRRLLVVPFTKRFEGKAADRTLSKKLLTELDGIFQWALEGLYRLYSNDGFTEPRSVKEMLKQYQFQNNPVQAFVDEWCVLDPEGVTTKKELYWSYRDYAKDFGYDSLPLNSFFRDLHRALPELKSSRIGPKNAREYAVKGIRLKEPRKARLG